MVGVSRCPKCGQFVGVPADVPPTRRVRCPYCSEEYPLGDMAAGAPPALILLDAGGDEEPDLVVDAPLRAGADESEEDASRTVSAAGESVLKPTEGEPAIFDIRMPEDDRKGKRRRGLATVYADAVDFPAVGQNDMHSSAAIAARLRQNATRHGMSGELLKIVFGGVAGLAIGYYLLNYFGGPAFDKLPIYLPGCPHTYRHWPGDEQAEPDMPTRDPIHGDRSDGFDR